jgi:hypothetical protein
MKIELTIAELKIIHACLIVAKNNAIENLNDKALSIHAIKNLDLINPLSYEIYSHIKENQRT